MVMPNHALQANRAGRLSSVSRFTLVDPRVPELVLDDIRIP
jgi:hypothetical protein